MRANAGECLVLKLRNVRETRSSLSLGELVFDPQKSYGAAIGFNEDSTIPAGKGRVYRYYADRELGLVLGLNLGDVDSVERGAFAGLVVEPEGAVYRRPGSQEPLPQGGLGIQADIVVDGNLTREFVALFNDQDRRIGQSAMPYPVAVENFAGINYSAEPLDLRNMTSDPAGVFRSDAWGDPRQVVTVPAGTPLVYRVGQPWGNQAHVPTLEGHRFLQEPGFGEGSEQLSNDVLLPGMSLNFHFVGGAGGDMASPGDYLFLDRRQPFLEKGLWNLLRVTEDGSAVSPDQVTVRSLEQIAGTEGPVLKVAGIVSPRPAGDTVPSVAVYGGVRSDKGCSGPFLGNATVDPGSGRWELERAAEGLTNPDQVCVQSMAGGVMAGVSAP